MCSICRNKNCIYRFGEKSWKPPGSEYVTYVLPESDLTFLESVHVAEEQIRQVKPVRLRLIGKRNEKKKKKR